MKKNTGQAVAILRVSQLAGREGTGFHSVDIQREEILRWARNNGYEVVKFHDETDSVSGRTTKRKGLQAAVAQVMDERNDIDTLIAYNVSRFARHQYEGLKAVHEMTEKGGRFVTASDGMDTRDDFKRTIMLPMLLGLAEAQYQQLKQGWEHITNRAVNRGVQGRTPYGYQRVRNERGATEKLVPNPHTAPIVKRMYAERTKGYSWQAIADGLNDDGIAPPGRAKQWTYQTVAHMVGLEAHIGVCSRGDVRNEKAWPAIVKRAMWDNARAMKQTPPPRAGSLSLLSGVLRCGSCGGRMVRHYDSQKDFRGYRCQRTYSWGDCPMPSYVAGDAIDAFMAARFKADVRNLRPKGRRVNTEIEDATAELDEARAELAAFMEDPANDRLAAKMPKEHANKQNRLIDAVEAKEDALTVVRERAMGIAIPRRVADEYDELSLDDQRELLARLYPVVAVAAAGRARRGAAPALADRVRVWRIDDPRRPVRLPGCKGWTGEDGTVVLHVLDGEDVAGMALG